MSDEVEISEELAEEIRKSWCKDCRDAVIDGDTMELLDGCETDSEAICAERVRQNIRLILSAVHKGDLDEALGVVGRGIIVRGLASGDLRYAEWDGEEPVGSGGCDFIALREEEK